MKQSALTIPTLVTEQGHDTSTAAVIIVLAIIGLAFWAAAEYQLLYRELTDPDNIERLDEDRDAIARATGLIDRRKSAPYAGEFADQVEARLRRDERGQADGTLLVSAIAAVTR